MRTPYLLAPFALGLLGAASLFAADAPTAEKPAAAHYGQWGVDLTGFNKAVAPGDDFDEYVNGAWRARTPIPADQTSASSFYDVYNLTLAQKKYVVASEGPGTQIGGLYTSFMDEKGVEKTGDAALRAELAKIAALPDKSAFARYMGGTMSAFGRTLFSAGVDTDTADPSVNVIWLGQDGLGLPDRDYYLKDEFKPQRDAYVAYIARQLGFAGIAHPAKAAADILAFETQVAQLSWPVADRREIEKINNPMTLAQIETYAPGFDWAAFTTAAGIDHAPKFIVAENTAVKALADLFGKTPLDTLKAWQTFGVTTQASPYLPDRYVQSRFQFLKAQYGLQELAPRWKRADAVLDGSLGELMGQRFVADFFPATSKTMMEELVANLKVAMANRIVNNEWMSPATKMAALEKLAKMDVMVGYPDKFRDYSGLAIKPTDLYGNMARSGAFAWQYELSKLKEPVDRKKWAMNPQEVNAYNGGQENKIVFPAGILQPPFFDPQADAAVNYGAIGAVIGHEISHGFDDQGRKIDASGAVRDWWTAEDAARFQAQADRFGAQYDTYEPVPGMHVNGKLTMGENIADMAGVLVALDAYHASLKGKPAPVIDGFTGDQRFFLSFAQVWRENIRPDTAKAQMAADPHTPSHFRIIGPLRNVDAWYAAFDVKPGSRYYLPPEERVRLW